MPSSQLSQGNEVPSSPKVEGNRRCSRPARLVFSPLSLRLNFEAQQFSEPRMIIAGTCDRCGASFERKRGAGGRVPTRSYCSESCRVTLARRGRKIYTCEQCGIQRVNGDDGKWARFCSQGCKRAWWEANVRAPLRTVDCRECGKTFTTRRSQKLTCSRRCHNRLDGRRRNSGRVSARRPDDEQVFTILDIAVRDRWTCHLCGDGVERSTWTLDHLIPQSQGGEHSRTNVKLAHRSCNSRRGTKPLESLSASR